LRMSAIRQIGLLTPVYGVSGSFCAAQTVRVGPASPPACDHQLVWGAAGAGGAGGVGVWAKTGAAPHAMASTTNVLSDFTETSLSIFF
jgi:hypothetical protein